MAIKKWFNIELTKIKQVAVVGSVVLLTLNIALSAYPYLAWRGIHPYLGITVVFFLILGGIWLLAHLYMNIMEMYKEQKLAETILYNPYSVYLFSPWQEVTWRYYNQTVLEALQSLVQDPAVLEKLHAARTTIDHWFTGGYIPRKDFPPTLHRYYRTKREGRL